MQNKINNSTAHKHLAAPTRPVNC